MYESTKRAIKNYREKLKAKGISQHPLLCTQKEFYILKTILKVLKTWNSSEIVSLDVDEDSKTIRLIEKESGNFNQTSEEN